MTASLLRSRQDRRAGKRDIVPVTRHLGSSVPSHLSCSVAVIITVSRPSPGTSATALGP